MMYTNDGGIRIDQGVHVSDWNGKFHTVGEKARANDWQIHGISWSPTYKYYSEYRMIELSF